jgi:hypothetical protein
MAIQLYLDINRFSRWIEGMFGRKGQAPIGVSAHGKDFSVQVYIDAILPYDFSQSIQASCSTPLESPAVDS